MAAVTDNPSGFNGRYKATTNLSSATNLYRLVRASTSADGCRLVSAATQPVIGVLYNLPNTNEAARVATAGVVLIRKMSTAVAAIALGDKIRGTTVGAAAPATLVTQFVIGRAEAAMSSGTTGFLPVRLTFEGAGSSGAASVA